MAVEYYNLGGALSQDHGKACLVIGISVLTRQLVMLAITDEEVEKGNKIQMIQKLLSFEKPTSFSL